MYDHISIQNPYYKNRKGLNVMETLKITSILKEKALKVVQEMTTNEKQRDIPHTPFIVSRGVLLENDLLFVGEVELGGINYPIYQKLY